MLHISSLFLPVFAGELKPIVFRSWSGADDMYKQGLSLPRNHNTCKTALFLRLPVLFFHCYPFSLSLACSLSHSLSLCVSVSPLPLSLSTHSTTRPGSCTMCCKPSHVGAGVGQRSRGQVSRFPVWDQIEVQVARLTLGPEYLMHRWAKHRNNHWETATHSEELY